MLKNYFKTAIRNLFRHKTDSSINIIGLCVAFTSAMLLLLSVYYEFSYDKFHANAKDIYQLYFTVHRPGKTEMSTTMPLPLLPALRKSYPEVKQATRMATGSAYVRYKDKTIDENLVYADHDFFSMFSFPLQQGDTANVLKGSNTIVIRSVIAKAIFDKEDPMGKLVDIKLHDKWQSFIVAGVGGEYPDNSSINYDIVVPFDQQEDNSMERRADWGSRFFDIFVQLNNTSRPAFEKRLPNFVNQHLAEDITKLKRDGGKPDAAGHLITLNLLPLLDIHTDNTVAGNGSVTKSYLYLLLTIAALIVAIACINFVNLSIGRSFTRSREIGLRKTLGARQKHIMLQLWGEAFLLCGVALLLSCVLTWFLLAPYKQLFGLSVQKSLLLQPFTWLAILAGFIVVTVLAGIYPAWVMGRLQIVNILKGKTAGGNNRLRNSLIVVQFGVAIFLITCTLISWRQITYLRSQPLGFNTAQVISIPAFGEESGGRLEERLRQKLAGNPAIESVTGIYNNLGRGTDGSSMSSIMGFEYNNHTVHSYWYGVSYDFVKTLDLQLVDGRDFSRALATDSAGVVINEAMARALGDKVIVGKNLPVDSQQLRVLGVVKDFNFRSLHHKIEPLTLVLSKDFGVNYILVKVQAANAAGSMDLLKKTWKEIAPGSQFQASFLDENVNRQYRSEEKLRKIFITGALITIVLSCMGLLAMVVLIVSQRVKEIGIRKVLGASVGSIIQLVARDFVVLVVIAAAIAFPVAWYFMHNWLQEFAYRAGISWWLFVIAGVAAVAIAYITISLQAMKAARRNPVKSLRSE